MVGNKEELEEKRMDGDWFEYSFCGAVDHKLLGSVFEVSVYLLPITEVRYSSVSNSDIYITFSFPFGYFCSLQVYHRSLFWRTWLKHISAIPKGTKRCLRYREVTVWSRLNKNRSRMLVLGGSARLCFYGHPEAWPDIKLWILASHQCPLSSHPYKKKFKSAKIMFSQNILGKETVNIILLCFILIKYCIFHFEMENPRGSVWDFQETNNGTYTFWSCWLRFSCFKC